MDNDGNGEIDYNEFSVMMEKMLRAEEEAVQEDDEDDLLDIVN